MPLTEYGRHVYNNVTEFGLGAPGSLTRTAIYVFRIRQRMRQLVVWINPARLTVRLRRPADRTTVELQDRQTVRLPTEE